MQGHGQESGQSGDQVEPGFIRLSAGIEDTDDLVADVVGAIDAVA